MEIFKKRPSKLPPASYDLGSCLFGIAVLLVIVQISKTLSKLFQKNILNFYICYNIILTVSLTVSCCSPSPFSYISPAPQSRYNPKHLGQIPVATDYSLSFAIFKKLNLNFFCSGQFSQPNIHANFFFVWFQRYNQLSGLHLL